MIPQLWQEALQELQMTDPSAVIAGGAIRDLFCVKNPKDVDFFSRQEKSAFFKNRIAERSDKDYKGMKYIVGIADYKLEIPPFSIIYHKSQSLELLLKSFDFGICQIAWNGSEVIKTAEFDWDFKYGVITLRHGDRFLRSIERFNRINKKYNWPLAIGDGVQISLNCKEKGEIF